MNQGAKKLTEGVLWKQILFFSIPLVLSNLLQVLFNMSDIAVVGQFAGSNALGSVGSTTTLVALFTGILIGMGSGINVIVARFYGAQDPENLEETVHTSLILSALIGLALLVLGLVLANPILALLKTKEELLDGAALYLRIYFLGMPATGIYNFGNAVFSAVGNTKKPLIFLSISGAVNIVLNLFFVIVCNLDVAGVAIASAVSQWLSAILIVVSLLRVEDAYGIKPHLLKLTRSKAALVLKLGLPAGLQNAVFQVANLFIQFGVNSFSATVVSGNSAAANADTMVYDTMAAVYTACGSFIGQNLGAGNMERVKKSYRISLAYSVGVGVVLGLLLEIFGRQFLHFFSPDPAVVEAGLYRLRIMALSYWISPFMDCTISASRGLGMSFVPTVIVVLGSCLFRIAWIFTVFAFFGTLTSLYLLYMFSWTITAIAEIAYYHRVYHNVCRMYRPKESAA